MSGSLRQRAGTPPDASPETAAAYPPRAPTSGGIGLWEPLFIGDPGRALFAGLHRCGMPAPGLGVLLVPPLFHEQPRSRRLLAEVASGLAAAGLPALRFDFFGTGDSDGDSDDCDFASMHTDMDMALRALCAETGVGRVALLGWRGAALPLLTARDLDARVAVVVLWEPIFDGPAWLAELERLDAAERKARQHVTSRVRPVDGNRDIYSDDDGQLMGIAVSARLRRDIRAATVDDASVPRVRRWLVARAGSDQTGGDERTFLLPADAPTFGDGVRMDQALFMSPGLQPVVRQLADALLEIH